MVDIVFISGEIFVSGVESHSTEVMISQIFNFETNLWRDGPVMHYRQNAMHIQLFNPGKPQSKSQRLIKDQSICS